MPIARYLRLHLSIVSLLICVGAIGCGSSAAHPPVVVYAAASLQTGLDALIPEVESAIGILMVPVYGASSAMARQIEQGAPAEVFVSADQGWMDYLHERGRIQVDTKVDLLTNRLVVISRAGLESQLDVADLTSWQRWLGSGRLAVADPAGVPAGRYAQEALSSLGIWTALADRLAPGENVRAALQLVARGEAPLGIVYRTDALAEPNVRLVAMIAQTHHSPIVYPAALTITATPNAARVLRFLQGETAVSRFRGLGFGTGVSGQ